MKIDGIDHLVVVPTDVVNTHGGRRAASQGKVAGSLSTGADAVAAGNIGCLVQIRAGLERRRARVRVYHTMELLELAYLARRPP